MEAASMERVQRWNNRLMAVAIGLVLAMTALTVRH